MEFFSEPTLVFALIEVVLGIALLTTAADEFVEGAANVATAARISPVLVGAVIVGFGTSAPELLVSGIAAFNGDLDLGLGNIVGSNVANLSLVLGSAALLVRLVVSRPILIREAPLSLLAVLLFAYFTTGGLARWEGFVLLGALVASLTWVIVGGLGASRPPAVDTSPARARADHTTGVAPVAGERQSAQVAVDTQEGVGRADDEVHPSLSGQLARTLFGLVGTVAGAQLLVWGATAIADDVGLTGGFVGFTLVAVGTSLPELVTAVMAARKGETELILGNLLGSNMFNSLAVGGAIAILGPGPIADEGLRSVGVIVMVVVAVGAWFAMATLRRVYKFEAVALLAAWFVAVILLARVSSEAAAPIVGSLL